MSLTTEQYNEIKRVLDGRRAFAYRDQSRKQEEAEKAIPALSDLNEELMRINREELSARFAKDREAGKKKVSECVKMRRDLLKTKKDLLKEYGFRPDQLEPSFTCRKCGDTGYVENEKCSCFASLEAELINRESGLPGFLPAFGMEKFSSAVYDDSAPMPDLPGRKLTQKAYMEKNVIPWMIRYVEEFDRPGSHNLFLTGPSGTGKTKVLILPFPNNPTGSIMEKKDLEAIRDVIIENDIYVMSDEIYAELTYKEKHTSIVSLPGMKERTILINGFSKAYAMTGWRLGYACGPEVIIKQMTKIHQFCIMCAPTTSQYAAVEALKNGDADVAEMRTAYNQRRRFLVNAFKEMGVDCFEPFGAFYIFPCIKEFGMSSDEFATRFLSEEKVAVVPGTAFGDSGEGFLRISYAYSMEQLKEAMKRFARFVEKLRAEK